MEVPAATSTIQVYEVRSLEERRVSSWRREKDKVSSWNATAGKCREHTATEVDPPWLMVR